MGVYINTRNGEIVCAICPAFRLNIGLHGREDGQGDEEDEEDVEHLHPALGSDIDNTEEYPSNLPPRYELLATLWGDSLTSIDN